MRWQRIRGTVAVVIVVASMTCVTASRASLTVFPGWDLLYTDPSGTTFMGANFQGVPLGTYDFGGGAQSVGGVDTIVHRLAPGTVPMPGSTTIPIELVALQLQSVNPVDLGAGMGTYYITLQSVRGGPSSLGQIGITFGPEGQPHGTFDSFFNLFFDVRFGSLSGTIVSSPTLQLSGVLPTPWQHAPTGPVVIDGVNHNLSGGNTDTDFWPASSFVLFDNSFTPTHTLGPTPVPEVSTSVSAALLLAFIVLVMLRENWPKLRLRQE